MRVIGSSEFGSESDAHGTNSEIVIHLCLKCTRNKFAVCNILAGANQASIKLGQDVEVAHHSRWSHYYRRTGQVDAANIPDQPDVSHTKVLLDHLETLESNIFSNVASGLQVVSYVGIRISNLL